jgi:hypothetical protein
MGTYNRSENGRSAWDFCTIPPHNSSQLSRIYVVLDVVVMMNDESRRTRKLLVYFEMPELTEGNTFRIAGLRTLIRTRNLLNAKHEW